MDISVRPAPCPFPDARETLTAAVGLGYIKFLAPPEWALRWIEGKLKLRFTVSETGEVTQVDVLQGIDPGLDAAVVAAAQRWRFKPAQACGKPVAGGTYVFAARFELGN